MTAPVSEPLLFGGPVQNHMIWACFKEGVIDFGKASRQPPSMSTLISLRWPGCATMDPRHLSDNYQLARAHVHIRIALDQ